MTDARAEESLQLKIFNRDYKTSNKHMRQLLKKADLESHGYKKELTMKVVSENGSEKQLFEKSFFYYKIVECTRLKEISQELETLVQGKNRILSFINLFSLEGKWRRINPGKDGLLC